MKETEEIPKGIADRIQKVARLDKVTPSHAATAEESAAAGEELGRFQAPQGCS